MGAGSERTMDPLAREQARKRRYFWMRRWQERRTLYSPRETERLRNGVLHALEEEFGPTTSTFAPWELQASETEAWCPPGKDESREARAEYRERELAALVLPPKKRSPKRAKEPKRAIGKTYEKFKVDAFFHQGIRVFANGQEVDDTHDPATCLFCARGAKMLKQKGTE